MTVEILPATTASIRRAADILRSGGLVAMPTETVYGLAADAANADAILRLYETKGRPHFNPLIAHVPDTEAAHRIGQLSDTAEKLSAAFWPGPLTLVLPYAENGSVCDLARAGLNTIAVRCPAHPAARDLLAEFGSPLVAPSANISSRLSPTTAQHVAEQLGSKIDLILDGGPCDRGLESTIIDCTQQRPALLRHGALALEAIEAVVGALAVQDSNDKPPTAPGQLLKHYAPKAALRLNAENPGQGEALLGFGAAQADLNLSETGDLREAAKNLFAMLHALDAKHTAIAVSPIPDTGLGRAINDRLQRASKRD